MMPKEVAALPRPMGELWRREFRRLREECGCGWQEAEALAWRVFRRHDAARQAAAKGGPGGAEVQISRQVQGGTPEWVSLLTLRSTEPQNGLVIDRRAVATILSQWDERGSDLLVKGGPPAGCSPPFTLPEVVGWLRALEVRDEALWGRFEWTEPMLALFDRPQEEFQIVVSYVTDASRRPVSIKGAWLKPGIRFMAVAGFELGVEAW